MSGNTAGRLVVASHNPGKVREIAVLLAEHGVPAVAAAELGIPEPEETGATFAENATLKATAAAAASGLTALADDSGLAVAALNGQPGIHSARWAGPERDFAVAMARIERELSASAAAADRAATFVCVLALAWPHGRCELFEGRIEGTLVWPPRGTHGFGYDPIFVPKGGRHTFAEMEPAAKQADNHRARAFAKLLARGFADLR